MPSKTPSELLAALVTQRYPIAEEVWGDFWDRLAAKSLHPGEALAVLASLTTRIPDGASVATLLGSLKERNPRPDPPSRRTVNIVGTGGGPSTFNLSTASAFVANQRKNVRRLIPAAAATSSIVTCSKPLSRNSSSAACSTTWVDTRTPRTLT